MKLNRIFAIVMGIVVCGAFPSCDDDSEATPLDNPEVSNDVATVSSLTFSWDAVEGAVQYAYELYDPEEKLVDGDVTVSTTVTFTGLEDNTTYTLKVWAFSAYGSERTTSPVAVLTATTGEIVQLAAPAPTVVTDGAVVIVSWNEVANAGSYVYSYTIDGGVVSESTTLTSVRLSGLPVGEYTFSVYAKSDSEAYSDSEPASVVFSRMRVALWDKEGSYYSSYYKSFWDARIVSYDDGSYVIEKWYGYDGYDLEFSVNDDKTIEILNSTAYMDNYGYMNVPTGIPGYDLPLWPYYDETYGFGYSSFSGNSAGGSMYVLNGWTDSGDDDCYDRFSWGGSSGPGIEDLCGSFTAVITGTECVTSSSWTDFEYEYTLTLTEIDDVTVSLNDFFWTGLSLTGTVDFEAKTITFAPQPWGVYRFCLNNEDEWGYISDEQPVVAIFDDSYNITIPNWTATYDNYTYVVDGAATLVKQ